VLDPIVATSRGVAGHDAEMTDYSPDGPAARAALDRKTVAELSQIHPTEADRMAAEVMRERLQVAVDQDEAGERLRDLRIIGSPFQSIRQCFDLMPNATVTDWEVIAARMERVPQALASFEAALREGQRRRLVAARRQALVCADQGATWSGQKQDRPFFEALAARYEGLGARDASLQRRLAAAAVRASDAYARASRFLREDYAPAATERDAVGLERYQLSARAFLGAAIDLEETYRWAWEELHRIEERMATVARKILPGEPLPAVVHLLETDPARSIDGVDAFRDWLQALMDQTIAELDGAHFDIPGPVKRVEAMIAPPGGAAAASIALAMLAWSLEEQSLFMVGVGGALLAPFVTSAGRGDVVILFSYGWLVVACAIAALRGRNWNGAVALLVVSPLLLLVNPYGLSIVSYYGATLFNSQFGKVVTEWEAVTTMA